MSAGGGRHRDRNTSVSGGADTDGLGEFASETDDAAAPVAPRNVARHALESPRLVPIVVALAVIGYGSLMVVWWERERPEVKPSFSSTPTTSFRPSAPQPSAPEPAAPVNAVRTPAVEPRAEIPDDFFVPAVARAGSAVGPTETAATRPEPLPPLLPGAADEDPPAPVPVPSPPPVVAASPEVTTPAAATAASARAIEPPVDRLTADRTAIGGVLQSYRTAYNALDATSASTIWQGLDTRALQRAFATLSRQDVSFDRCDVRVTSADRAVASCRGVLSYVPKIGDGTPQQRRLSWSFDFQRAADRWLIASVSAR
jgi:hypothetical protein